MAIQSTVATGTSSGSLRDDFKTPFHIDFRAIAGGTICALGVWVLLYALGLAIGLTSIDPDDAGSLRGSSIFTGIWGVVVPLIALFVGGFVASRSSGLVNRIGGALHGVIVWGLTALIGVWMVGRLFSAVIGGAVDVGSSAVHAGSEMLPSAAEVGSAASSLGIDAESALAPVNARLRAEGKPAVTAEQLRAATADVVKSAATTGELDRAKIEAALADRTALSRTDAKEVAQRIEAQLAAASDRVSQVAKDVGRSSLQVAETTGKALWGLFGALLLGLLAALAGGVSGVTDDQIFWARESSQTGAAHPDDGARRGSQAIASGLPPTVAMELLRGEVAQLRSELRLVIGNEARPAR
jgi:hypothetical protein